MFGAGIEAYRWFVEDDNRRILQKDACQGNAMTLAAREAQSRFIEYGVETFRQSRKQFFQADAFKSAFKLLVACLGFGYKQIVAQGVVEQVRSLLADAEHPRCIAPKLRAGKPSSGDAA